MPNNEEKDTSLVRGQQYDNLVPHNNNNNSPKESIVEKLLNPWDSYPRNLWIKIFLVTCVIGVLIDPLFLYVPIINAERKCLTVDKNLKYIALILRTAIDFSYILHQVFRLRNAKKSANELNVSMFRGLPWSHLLNDILAILPLPQVIVMKFFAKLAGSRSLKTRKIINILLLLQYIPRLVRVFLSAKMLGKYFDSLASRLWVRGAFLFFLYIIFGHIFGALWYFYAIFSETACWHSACKNLRGCEPASPFDCHRLKKSILNITYLNDFCPVDPPNPKVYDFGIFSHAIESKILQTTDFPKKISLSFWWGLRNLSSFGQNLDTSADVEENFFAVLISILGLLLFLYLIGTLQTYMQLATTKSEEERSKLNIKRLDFDSLLTIHNVPEHIKKVSMHYFRHTIKEGRDFDAKHLIDLVESGHEHPIINIKEFAVYLATILDVKKDCRNTVLEMKVDLWLSINRIDEETKAKISKNIRLRSIERKDVDVVSLLNILPSKLGKSIKKFLCVPILKKVPMLENMNDDVYETMCCYLKPVVYTENSYIIKKGEPLDFMLFVTEGVVLIFGNSSTTNSNRIQSLKKGDFYGSEILEWLLNTTSLSDLPISESNLKCHTKVEAFSLKAIDLTHVFSNCWAKFLNFNGASLKYFAAVKLQQEFQRFIHNKKTNDHRRELSIVTYK